MEAYVQTGADLITAVERVDESLGLLSAPAVTAEEKPVERVPTARENDAALAELQKLMGGLA